MKDKILNEVDLNIKQLEEIKSYVNGGPIHLEVILIPVLIAKHNLSNLSFLIEDEIRRKKNGNKK